MVDETEARWQRYIKQRFPSLNFVEIYWESTRGLSNHTFENAVSLLRPICPLLVARPFSACVFNRFAKSQAFCVSISV
jgi:hypothetical protein